MKLRTYRATNMGEALAQVKKDLGKDAVILHTRAYKVGTIFGFGGRPRVEVTASHASETPARSKRAAGREVGREAAREAGREARGASALARAYEPSRGSASGGTASSSSVGVTPAPATGAPTGVPVGPLGSGPSAAASLARAVIRTASAVDAQALRAASAGGTVSTPRPAAEGVVKSTQNVVVTGAGASADAERAPAQAGLRLAHDGGPVAGSDRAADETLRAELSAIKRMIGQVLQDGRSAGVVPMPDALLATYLQLLEAEVSRELADQIVASVRDELTGAELGDVRAVREAVCGRLAGMLPAGGTLVAPARSGLDRPFTIALVGPTGVGKTTTLAKLAAAHKLRHGRSVGLVTCDTYRIAAVEQLRTYAGIIGVPLKVAMTPAEMSRAMSQLSGCDVVLIDTAGRSPSDAARLGELREMLGAARPHQTHLVLSSAAGVSTMTRAAERFAGLSPDHVIFTKLDEAVSFGVLVETARRVTGTLGCKLSYVTTGQEVPDDIEPSRADRLARLVLEGALQK